MKWLALAVVVMLVMVSDKALTSTGATGQINVTATLSSSTIALLPPVGRRGDLHYQRWRLTDRFGRHIGRMYFSCAWVVVQARLCLVEIQMPQGKIVAAGSSPTILRGEFAVTGGTGRYRGGGGIMQFTAVGLGKQVLRVEVTT